MGYWENFCTGSVVRQWNRLPRAVVTIPEEIKRPMDVALGDRS